MDMRELKVFRWLGWCCLTGFFAVQAVAGESAAADTKPANEMLVELFTSHGCSSCPPADELLGRLLEDHPELVALEYHVDYWNDLIHGSDGNWVDPFSSSDYTLRQRQYNQTGLVGRPGVYTPQLLVNGQFAAVGSDESRIRYQLGRGEIPSGVTVSFSDPEDSTARITIDNSDNQQGEVWLVTYRINAETAITAGENRHRTLINHHIVDSVTRVAPLNAGRQEVQLALPEDDRFGCAVLVQQAFAGRLHAAARCPTDH